MSDYLDLIRPGSYRDIGIASDFMNVSPKEVETIVEARDDLEIIDVRVCSICGNPLDLDGFCDLCGESFTQGGAATERLIIRK